MLSSKMRSLHDRLRYQTVLTKNYLMCGLLIILIVLGFSFLDTNPPSNYNVSNSIVVKQDARRPHHRLLLWIAAYDTIEQRDECVIHQLNMARDICESSTPQGFVRVFVGTKSEYWLMDEPLREFRNRNADRIVNITTNYTTDDFTSLIHFNWSCVELMIAYYHAEVGLALPYQHRKYFHEHVNDFDWFWYTEEDILFDNEMYWYLINDTSFALSNLSSEETNHLLKLYAENGKKPRLSPTGRYFLLPTALRFEKPSNNESNSTIHSTDWLELWRLTDLALAVQPIAEALIFFKNQWWIQPSSPHTAYYLLPREHIKIISREKQRYNETNARWREFVSSFWLSDFGYIRITSITNYKQYLIHHSSNRYYDVHGNLPTVSLFTRQLGFESERNKFVPRKEMVNARLLEYTNEHEHDIASCFPLFFSLPLGRLHEGIPICPKLFDTIHIHQRVNQSNS